VLHQGFRPLAARALNYGLFRAAQRRRGAGGALKAYCDRGGKRAHLENIKGPGVEKRNFFRGNRHGGMWLE
jgi:hypothetical protein